MAFIFFIFLLLISSNLCVSQEECSVIEKRSKDLKPCIFPFKFSGATYNKCTDVNDPDDRLWCSTKIDDYGNHVPSGGFWGHCGEDCNIGTDHRAELSFSSISKDFSKCGENIDPYRIHQSRSVGLWPWMASLGFWSDEKWNHKCGATLIDQTRIITAGHCIENKKEMKKSWHVRLGDFNHSSKSDDGNVQQFNIEEIYVHPNFVLGIAYYDIAVLEIPPVEFTLQVRPICLPRPSVFNQDLYDGKTVTLLGWGSSFEHGKQSDTLKRTILTIHEYSFCNTTHANTSGKIKKLVENYLPDLFQPSILCAGYESAEQGACKGDSGGPLMVFNTKLSQYFQIGLVSGGVSSSCGDKDIPGYYTRLDYPEIADFIESPDQVLTLVEPVDCIWNNWSQFSECSQTCGRGIKTRTRIVKTLNSFNGVPCDGPASETDYCQLRECPQTESDDVDVPPGRTRICKEGEFPGKRNKRESEPEAPKPCWFIPDPSIKSGDDCGLVFSRTQTCEKSQVFVPLGVTEVCIKFEAAPKWFLSEGTNGYCGVSDCCEWYPKETKKVVFCNPKRPLLNWYPQEADSDCSESPGEKPKIGIEIIKGSAGETKDICLAVGQPEDEGGVVFITAPAKLSHNCGGGCCIFELLKKDD